MGTAESVRVQAVVRLRDHVSVELHAFGEVHRTHIRSLRHPQFSHAVFPSSPPLQRVQQPSHRQAVKDYALQ